MLRADPGRCPAALDTLIVATYCPVDDELLALLDGRRLRRRGPEPLPAAAEVVTIGRG